VNIEGFEYPLFAHVFEHPSANLAGVSTVHLELHRMGMQRFGLSWSSLVFYEMLLAHFFSGGFLPFAVEKWHDSTAATDVAFVNQSFYLESEVAASQAVRRALLRELTAAQERVASAAAVDTSAVDTSAVDTVVGSGGPALTAAAEAAEAAAVAAAATAPAASVAGDAAVVAFPPGTLSRAECAFLVQEAEAIGIGEIEDPVDYINKFSLTFYYCPDPSRRYARCEGHHPRASAQSLALLARLQRGFEKAVWAASGADVVVYWVYLVRYRPEDAKPGLGMHADSCDFTGNILLSAPDGGGGDHGGGDGGHGGGGPLHSHGGGEFYLLDEKTSRGVELSLGLREGEAMVTRNARAEGLLSGLAAGGGLDGKSWALAQGSGLAHPGYRVHGVMDVTRGARYSLIFFANRRGVITADYQMPAGA